MTVTVSANHPATLEEAHMEITRLIEVCRINELTRRSLKADNADLVVKNKALVEEIEMLRNGLDFMAHAWAARVPRPRQEAGV